MHTILRTDCRMTQAQVASRRRLACLALGMSVMLSACQQEANDTESQANLPAGTPAGPAPAAQPPTAADASVSSQIAAKRRTLVAEAMSAVQETEAALASLAAGKSDDAIAALERATGKLDIVLAADPNLALAPVDVRATVHDVIATPEAVTALRQRAEAALDNGRLQDARHMIADLASEHVISVTSLPLPLVRAEALLDSARPLAEKAQRATGESDQLRRLLDAARVQLELAQAIGYATKDDLDALSDELKTIKRRTEGQGHATGLFDRIKALFAKTKSDASKPRSEG